MGYILFLLSVLVATFYYFRMARRFDNFDTKIEEDLKREMNSLILDFNQSATQNITILEDRIMEGRSMIQDLALQLKYLKDLKDSLDLELRDIQKKFSTLQHQQNQYLLAQNNNSKNAVQRIYEKSNQKIVETAQQNMVIDSLSQKTEDSVDIDSHLFQDVQDAIIKKQQESKSVKKRPKTAQARKTRSVISANIPMETDQKKIKIAKNSETMSGKKAQILDFFSQGMDIDTISSTLGVAKGEVDLIVRLFQQ